MIHETLACFLIEIIKSQGNGMSFGLKSIKEETAVQWGKAMSDEFDCLLASDCTGH
jgi:hypothetical protein